MARGIPTEVLEHFRQIPLFGSVSKRNLRAIVQAATELDMSAGRVLVREGEADRHLFVIVSGTAAVTRRGRAVADLGPGDFFGELSFLDREPRSATVTTTSEVRLLTLGPRKMEAVVRDEPGIALSMLEAVASRIRETERSFSD